MIRVALASALLGSLLLTGCANQPKPLYYWGDYQPQVYEYFKGAEGKGQEEQIAALEETLQKARATDAALPPGYHAHLGLLYLKTGKLDQVKQQLETERSNFPESAAYMDFLLKKFKN